MHQDEYGFSITPLSPHPRIPSEPIRKRIYVEKCVFLKRILIYFASISREKLRVFAIRLYTALPPVYLKPKRTHTQHTFYITVYTHMCVCVCVF